MKQFQRVFFSSVLSLSIIAHNSMHATFLDTMNKAKLVAYYGSVQTLRVVAQNFATDKLYKFTDTYISTSPSSRLLWRGLINVTYFLTIMGSESLISSVGSRYNHLFKPDKKDLAKRKLYKNIAYFADLTTSGYTLAGILPRLSSTSRLSRFSCAPAVGFMMNFVMGKMNQLQISFHRWQLSQLSREEQIKMFEELPWLKRIVPAEVLPSNTN